MQKKSAFQYGFFHLRFLLAFALCSVGALLAVCSFAPQIGRLNGERRDTDKLERYMPVPGGDPDDLDRMEVEWNNRLTYPTGVFNPAWVRLALAQDKLTSRAVPLGKPLKKLNRANAPLALDPSGFTSLGPAPLQMTGCSGCYN